MNNSEHELKILELISQGKEDISQRDISRIIGLSLGMTNSILKRFAEKGLITIKKVNNRNIQYVLTARGIEEIGQRSWKYFKRTIRNVVLFKDVIQGIITDAVCRGYEEVILIGSSDLEFIVEHECYKLGIPFSVKEENIGNSEKKSYMIYAENESVLSSSADDHFSLNNLVYQGE